MVNNILQNPEIIRKNGLLENAKNILKSEFVGIDDVIETVVNNMRPWYLYPELQDKPLVVSLVGMSGTGKTSLVNRLMELLSLEKEVGYFNFAEINEKSAWEIEDDLEEKLNNGNKSKVFIYDEFQYAATLDENGSEKDNKGGMKAFWELMDSGIIRQRMRLSDFNKIKTLVTYIDKINSKCQMELENGVWKNCDECLSHFTDYEVELFLSVFNKPMQENKREDKQNVYLDDEYWTPNELFIANGRLVDIHSCYIKLNEFISFTEMRLMVKLMNINEIRDMLFGMLEQGYKGYKTDFSKSIIFVLMNLDEAYHISFDVNPDMLPDQFHKLTKKLTIVDIKEGLKRRFRNEQIARLGNLFAIYPAFSSDSFRKIIKLFTDRYAENVKERFGISLSFEDSVLELVYKDSVFPTHGTRPVISSIHEIIKTKFPVTIDDLNRRGVEDIDRMVYSYKDGDIYVSSYKGDKKVGETVVRQPLRVEGHRNVADKRKRIAIAVHESAHFVMYSKLFGSIPEKVCVGTVDKGTGGFMVKDEDELDKLYSKDECLSDIKVALAGYVAEKLVFKDGGRTVGASEDLLKATAIASMMVRRYGFGTRPEVTTYLNNGTETNGGMQIYEDLKERVNSEIKRIISACMMEVESTLTSSVWKKMLKDSASYLMDYPSIPKEKMQELYDSVPNEAKKKMDENYYMDCFNNF